MTDTKTCAHCGETFTLTSSKGRKQKYCTARCRDRASKLNLLKPPGECLTCGAPTAHGNAQYCSRNCRQRAHRAKVIANELENPAPRIPKYTERMLALEATHLPLLRREIKRLWNPIRHTWYIAEVGVVR